MSGADATSAGPQYDRVEALLTLAREQLGLPVAFLGRFDGSEREIRAVSSGVPLPSVVGTREPRQVSHCQRMVDGQMPNIVADVANTPSARDGIPAVEALGIGAFAGVPVRRPNGQLYGTLCCVGFTAHHELTDRDAGVLRVLASTIGTLVDAERGGARSTCRSREAATSADG
ncbi:MAG: GAF domain-containing protein [Propionibacteriales bacterium]|nr:GAF domain-containing protein [Propionibacteriales bacterium]